MERFKLSNNFYLDELVPPELYLQYGHNAHWFIRKEVVCILQRLRNRFGPIIVNNWSDGGKITAKEFLELPEFEKLIRFSESGFRLPTTQTGAPLSFHKYGAAADTKFLKAMVEEVKEDIIKDFHYYKELGLTTIEKNTTNWLHFDIRNTLRKELLIV